VEKRNGRGREEKKREDPLDLRPPRKNFSATPLLAAYAFTTGL